MLKIYDNSIKPFNMEEDLLKPLEREYETIPCPCCRNNIRVPYSHISKNTERYLEMKLFIINKQIASINNIINNSEIPYYLRKQFVEELEKITKGNHLKVIK